MELALCPSIFLIDRIKADISGEMRLLADLTIMFLIVK
jgi:hypothetical protein